MAGKLKRILVVSRMSKYCKKAIHAGISLARNYDAELCVIHVIHNPFGIDGWNLPMISMEEEYKNMRDEVKNDLDALLASEKTAGIKVTEFIRKGDPTEEILKVIAEQKIDLLVLLAHEEGHLEHFLFGRSNETLVRKMPCSILLVKDDFSTI